MPGPFFFAWVEPEETTFGVEHHRYDEQVVSFTREHSEGEAATLQVTLRNPRVGPLSVGRKTWVWLSWDSQDSDGVVPLFFGQLIAIPSNFISDTVQFTFTASPLDFDTRKQRVADGLKVRPYYDPVWLDLTKRDDPDAVLEGYSRLWHIDPVTHEVTTSDITLGEDGTEVFDPGDVPYDSVNLDLSQAPLLTVGVDATVSWNQVASGDVDMKAATFISYGGDGFVAEWPKPGATLNSGWSVAAGEAIDTAGIATALTASWSYEYQNKAKRHANGDTMSISISVTEPQLGENLSTNLTERIQTGVIDPYAVDEEGNPAPLNIPASTQITSLHVPLWTINTSLILHYEANRQRTERILFVVRADLQDIVTSPEEETAGEVITLSGDVGTPIISLLNWLAVRGLPVALGDVIFPEYPDFPGMRVGQICTQAGTAGETQPDFSPLIGDITLDNDVEWSSLGPVAPYTTARDWAAEDIIAQGTVILPKTGLIISYSQLMRPGMVQSPQVGVAVNEGQLIRTSNGAFHVCILSGSTGMLAQPQGVSVGVGYIGLPYINLGIVPVEPAFATTWGQLTQDGTATWFCLGMTMPDGAHYQICTQGGTTGQHPPPFSNSVGGVTVDGTVEWTNMGVGEIPVGGVPGNVTRSAYFPTDRGLESLEYLICVARARLLYRARAVKVVFNCTFERAVGLTCRKNAILTDPRLPGGQVLGKIMACTLQGGGDGVMIGTVTIGATIGRGNTVSETTGTPCYVDGYVDGYQEYDGQTLILPEVEDVGYTPPTAQTVDDGLVFPLTREQIVWNEAVHGNLSAQKTAIGKAFEAAKASANLSEIKPQSTQQSITVQRAVAALGTNSVSAAISSNPIWYQLDIRPVTNGPFDSTYPVATTVLVAPKMIDLEAPA